MWKVRIGWGLVAAAGFLVVFPIWEAVDSNDLDGGHLFMTLLFALIPAIVLGWLGWRLARPIPRNGSGPLMY